MLPCGPWASMPYIDDTHGNSGLRPFDYWPEETQKRTWEVALPVSSLRWTEGGPQAWVLTRYKGRVQKGKRVTGSRVLQIHPRIAPSPLQALSTCPPRQAIPAYLNHRKQGGLPFQGVLTRYGGSGEDNKARGPRQGQKASVQKDHLEGPDSKGGWESPSPLNSCETEASHHSSRTGTHLVSCLPTGLSLSAIICKEGRKSGPCPGMASKSSWSKGSFQFYLRFQPFV